MENCPYLITRLRKGNGIVSARVRNPSGVASHLFQAGQSWKITTNIVNLDEQDGPCCVFKFMHPTIPRRLLHKIGQKEKVLACFYQSVTILVHGIYGIYDIVRVGPTAPTESSIKGVKSIREAPKMDEKLPKPCRGANSQSSVSKSWMESSIKACILDPLGHETKRMQYSCSDPGKTTKATTKSFFLPSVEQGTHVAVHRQRAPEVGSS